MKKDIELHKRKVQYTLKVSNRAKRMRLAVYCDGDFVVTTPKNTSHNIIEKFIISRSKWILDKMDFFKSLEKSSLIKDTKATFEKYKEEAQLLAEKKVEEYNRIYKFRFNKIAIKNQKTRWGSCSKKGNLNFNYKIAILPEPLADYIVVHELCHLGEFNHSQKFWNLVAKTMPNYLEIRNDLKKQGLVLH